MLALVIMGISLAVLFGLYHPVDALKKLGSVALVIILSTFAASALSSIWQSLSAVQRAAAFLIAIVVAALAVWKMF